MGAYKQKEIQSDGNIIIVIWSNWRRTADYRYEIEKQLRIKASERYSRM